MPRNKNVGVSIPSIGTIIVNYIANKKPPVSWKELVEPVKKERSDLLSKDVGATIRSILSRDKRFVRTSVGMYDVKKES